MRLIRPVPLSRLPLRAEQNTNIEHRQNAIGSRRHVLRRPRIRHPRFARRGGVHDLSNGPGARLIPQIFGRLLRPESAKDRAGPKEGGRAA